MNKEDICFMPASQMLKAIKNQELTSLEITETIIERIEKINPIINAYCTLTFDLAREMAKKADEAVKKGEKLSPLHGIPTSIKDLNLTRGIRTTFGSKIYEDYIPDEDGLCVARLKKAGIVILGKTNTPEFGYAGVTDNKIFGPTKNPWNLKRTPGGSSGGAAAAVASGISPLALGGDGGGSIRHPATFCGIYGIKPQYGRVPDYPKTGVSFYFTQRGPLVRYVEDAALMLDILKGPHEQDRTSLPKQDVSYFEKINEKPDKLKVGYTLNLGYAKIIDSEVEKSVKDSVQKFEKLGWSIEPMNLKIRSPFLAFTTLYTASYAYNYKSYLKEWRDKMDPDFLKLIDAGMTYSGLNIMKAMDKRIKFYEKISELFRKYDILITPTVAIPAFELGMMFPPEINGEAVGPTSWMPFTFPFNMTGNPAATIPCGWSKDGLPIGMQIVGPKFDELTVLQVSKAFEEIAPWQDKKPQLK
ncbi:Acylamidase [subsurface metagenome]